MLSFLRRGKTPVVLRWAVLLTVCAATFAAMEAAERRCSPTADEPGHLMRGLAFWWAPDTRLSWPHPPLGQAIAAAPIAFSEEPIDFTSFKRWDKASFITPTRKYFKRDFPTARAQLRTARLTMALLAVLLALYLFEWTRRRYDELTAWLALFAYVANPVILANAILMTTDFPVAAATFVLVTQLHDYIVVGRRHLIGVLIAAALLPTTKLSGLLVLALMAPFGLGAAWFGAGRFAKLGRRRFSQSLFDLGLVLAVVWLAVLQAYRWHEVGLTVQEIMDHPRPSNWLSSGLLGEDSPIAKLPRDWRIPLPWTFLFSVAFVRAHALHGHQAYWFGELFDQGQTGYFVVLLGIKLPSAMVLMLVAGLGAIAYSAWRRRAAGMATATIAHLVVVYLVATFNARINLGLRHALPVVPAMAVLAARGITGWARRPVPLLGRGPLLIKVAAGAAVLSLVAGVAMAHPRYLADFNLLVGGREGGHRISLAAEDWGQDVGELGELALAEKWTPLIYYTHHSLRHYELRAMGVKAYRLRCSQPFPKGRWVAVHRWRSVTMPEAACIAALKNRKLHRVINDHIYVYAPEPPERPVRFKLGD